MHYSHSRSVESDVACRLHPYVLINADYSASLRETRYAQVRQRHMKRLIAAFSTRSPILLLVWLGFLLASAASAAAQKGTKRALLIGINKYQELPWLSGSRNDVGVMRDILIRRYGFDESNIQILLDEQAIRSGIINALENLVASAGPDDTIFVHYSGHGSQVEDLNGDEPDGLDETICPHDARSAEVADITDDELGQILGRLKVASAVVVLDSCHSGTALRSSPADIRPRSIPPDTRVELYRKEQLTTRGVVTPPGTEPYVLFSAAAANQQELDGPFGPNGQPLGLLTAAMSRALESRQDELSPRQLLAALEQNVEKLKPRFAGHPLPEAQLEGQIHLIEAPLFSPVNKGISNPELFTSAQQRPPGKRKKFFVQGNDRLLLKRSIPGEIGANVDWVDNASDADAVIDCTDERNCDVYGPNGIVRVARFMSPELQPGADGVVIRLADVAINARSVAELLSIDESSSVINLRLGATGRAPTASVPQGTRGIKLTASVANHHIRFYVPPEPRTHLNSLQLTVQTDAPCYLTLVSVDSAGIVTQLLPNPIADERRFLPDGYLQAYREYLIPDSMTDDNQAGFHMDYAPPAGTDTVRAFCTANLSLAESLRADIDQIVDGRPGVSLTDTLVANRGLTGLRPDQAQSNPGDWGSATITIDVAQK